MASPMRLMCLLCTSLLRCDFHLVASQATSLELCTLGITVNLIKTFLELALGWTGWHLTFMWNLACKIVKLMPV